jgi:hypothetical protein
MGAFVDLKNQRFGRLVVIELAEKSKCKHTQWKCLCDCGNYAIVTRGCLRDGYTNSCGCLRSEISPQNSVIHGHKRTNKRTTEYTSWRACLNRCYNPTYQNYNRYGGRGITVCDSWKISFVEFLHDMGLKPFPKAQLDRIDSNGNYEPSNCRWVSAKENANNRNPRMKVCNG